MSFTFTNYAGIEPQHSPYNDLIGRLLGGYTDMTKAKYLKPGLEEELKKAKLTNQYYGPNMESQMGLRSAQAGHLGSMTTGQNITNQYLPQQLQAQMEAKQQAAEQAKMFNQMLQQRLSGQGGQGSQGMPGMGGMGGEMGDQGGQQPGQGQFAQGEPMPQQMGQQQQQNPFAQEPQLTNYDIVNKKFFGQDTFGPRYKAYVDAMTSGMKKKQAEDFKLNAKKDFEDWKVSEQAQKDVPTLENALESAQHMKEIIQNRPALSGHTWFPGYYAKTSQDPEAGVFQSKLIPQMAALESQLSSKGNQLALKIAASKLPGFENSQAVNLGRIDGLIDEIQKRLKVSRDMGGGMIKRIGNKRYKKIDGEWHEVEKGDM
jgi:hypothetical protein